MNFSAARHNMVESQIRTNRVTDPAIIEAFESTPREAFLPQSLESVAYVDEALPIGGGRYLIEPMVLARLLQEAEVGSTDLALDVGCGPGYCAAILSQVSSAVVALESDAELAAAVTKNLSDLNITTVTVVQGPLAEGWTADAPYDVIVLGGAVETVPEALTAQLADGGRLVAVVIEDGVGRGTVITRNGDTLTRRTVFDAGTPVLPEFTAEPVFAF